MRLRFLHSSGLILLLMLLCITTPPVRAETIFQIEDYGIGIKFTTEKQDGELRLELGGLGHSSEKPKIETLNNPRRLVFDVPTNRRVRTFEEKLNFVPGIENIRVGGHNQKLRVVFDLTETFSPSGNIENNLATTGNVVLTFRDKGLLTVESQKTGKGNSETRKAYTIQGSDITTRSIRSDRLLSKTPHITHNAKQEDSLPSLIMPEEEQSAPPLVERQQETIPAVRNSRIQKNEKQLTPLDKALVSKMAIPESAQDPFNISSIPLIEEVSQYNSFIELLVMLLIVTFLAVVILRRSEIIALLRGGENDHSGSELLIESHGSTYTMPYVILGCKETDSDEKIKARYRHLVKVFHTDKLHSQELPPEVLELTDKEFQKVQQAYEQLKSMRGL